MNKKIKLLPLAMTACMVAMPVSAAQIESGGKDLGQVEGEFKLMHILGDAGQWLRSIRGYSLSGKTEIPDPFME